MKSFATLNLLATVWLSRCLLVDAICQAVDGVYTEPQHTKNAAAGTPAQVDLSFRYDLVPTTTTNNSHHNQKSSESSSSSPTDLPDETVVAETLQHRISDALVFTLFDDCRVDPNDKMSVVNLQRLVVRVTATQDYYTANVNAVGDTGVGAKEQTLGEMRLENAIRIVMNMHHVAKVGLPQGYTLTLHTDPSPSPKAPMDDIHDTPTGNTPPTQVVQPNHPLGLSWIIAGAGLTLLTALGFALHGRHTHSEHSPLPLHDELDDVELACTKGKPTDKLVPHEVLDETEISESSTSYEDEAW